MQPPTARIDRALARLSVETSGEVLAIACDALEAAGYVGPGYRQELRDRESRYPTGVPTQPEPCALPHADPEHVLEPFILPVTLARPVAWGEMGQEGRTVDVQIAFVVGMRDAREHLALLQSLLASVRDGAWMADLLAASSSDELARLAARTFRRGTP